MISLVVVRIDSDDVKNRCHQGIEVFAIVAVLISSNFWDSQWIDEDDAEKNSAVFGINCDTSSSGHCIIGFERSAQEDQMEIGILNSLILFDAFEIWIAVNWDIEVIMYNF